MQAPELLTELKQWKSRFGPGQSERIRELLAAADTTDFASAKDLIAYHELLLFLCAYPADLALLDAARAQLAGFSARVRRFEQSGGDMIAFEEHEASGIAGSGFTAVFSYEAARHLAARHGAAIRIDWDRHGDPSSMIGLLPLLTPLLDDEALVESHVDWRDWIETAAGGPDKALSWLLEEIARREPCRRSRADRYQPMALSLRWDLGDSPASRTHIRIPGHEPFFHDGPLIRRNEVRLDDLATAPELPSRTLDRGEAEEIIMLTRDTSATRYRELHGFNYGDASAVKEFDAGRGVRFFVWGAEPEHRLPLRAYHSASIWKNGIPIGYFEGLSLFDRFEAAFNLYYTFREGESAWLYRQLLKMFHQELGFRTISVDPYQIGHENDEAIDSGAFWFYRKLGFRSTDAAARRLTAREEKRIASQAGYRTPRSVLKKLAAHPIVLELPGAAPGEWDSFSSRQLSRSMAAGRGLNGAGLRGHWRTFADHAAADPSWTDHDRAGLEAVIEAKVSLPEAEYLRRMQSHRPLREVFLRAGGMGGNK